MMGPPVSCAREQGSPRLLTHLAVPAPAPERFVLAVGTALCAGASV